MHLLQLTQSGEIRLVESFNDDDTPPYAILSHTWGPPHDEVTFDDITNGRGASKVGYEKIRFCAEQARQDGLGYFWVDTCCINKAHLVELSESITSMFRWYQNAAKCYVYLDDVSMTDSWQSSFRACRWFTRGWTLQELLAPRVVEFFSRDGRLLGSKHGLSSLIQEITSIPISALRGTAPLSGFSPKVKMQWALSRNTTRLEDKVYSLQGIFDVYILPNYGEREYALVRLKREIGMSYESQVAEFGSLLTESVVTRTITPDDRERPTYLGDWYSALGFDEMYSRQAEIKAAHSTTCSWLLQTQMYKHWMDPRDSAHYHRFLWIMGKPGVGKSTLIKYALDRVKKSKNSDLVISYFFNARGGALEKSTTGMYRSLLVQLLHHAETLQHEKVLCDAFNDIFGIDLRSRPYVWSMESLRELLACAVKKLQRWRIRCFVDALDECIEQDIRDMVTHLENLGQISEGQNFQVCFASRHYPSIPMRYGGRLVIENEPGHSNDLTRYIEDYLQVGHGKEKALREIRKQIKSKANGVFMWAVLVINILNKEFSDGRIYLVQKRLDEIPSELSSLFRDILGRDRMNVEDLLLSIQWVLFAASPLKAKEFYYAMVAGLYCDSVGTAEWDRDVISGDDFERFVAASSKGLAELSTSNVLDEFGDFDVSIGAWTVRLGRMSTTEFLTTEEPYLQEDPRTSLAVHFIHESVKDFLLKDGGLYEIWPEFKDDFRYRSHDRLRRCCQNYLTLDLKRYIPSTAGLLDTDIRNANRVAGETMDTLIDKFPFLVYAVSQAFYHAENAASRVPQHDLLTGTFLQNWSLVLGLAGEFEDFDCSEDMPRSRQLNYALYHVAGRGFLEMTKALLHIGADVNAQSLGFYSTALCVALAGGYLKVVELLLGAGADVDACGVGAGNPLYVASAEGNLQAVELLLTAGVHVDPQRGRSGDHNALYAACDKGFQDVVKLLLNAGTDPNVKGGQYGDTQALYTASEKGYHKVVKLLLDAGADVNAAGGRYGYGHALDAALRRGHKKVAELLLDAGAQSLK